MDLFEVAFDSFVLLQSYWSAGRALTFMAGIDATHVIVHREEVEKTYYYLYTLPQVLGRLANTDPKTTVHDALDLHEYKSVDTRQGSENADDAPDQVVVLDGEEVAGFFDANAATLVGGVTYRGSVPRTTELRPSPAPSPGGVTHREGSAPVRFEAWPSLNAPAQSTSDKPFDIFVGFRGDSDPALVHSGRMTFTHIEPGDECLIIVIGDGVDIDRNHDLLPFRENAQVKFTCTPRPGVAEANVKAQYFHRQQLIGTAQRSVTITAAGAHSPQPPIENAPNPCRLDLPTPEREVDLTVTITYSNDGDLQWTFTAPKPVIEVKDPITTPLQGAKEFAAGLISDLKTENHTGPLAANILESKGQEVFQLMPPELIDALKKVHAAIGRTPTLLLVTNETYVPWELAYLPAPLDPAKPHFLAAQTHMGRWLDDQNVMLPPSVKIEIKRMTAVASKYGLGTSMRELPEALAERELLAEDWKAIPLEAKKAEVTSILAGVKVPGHLVHFAVHGISDPNANHQAILLADNSEIRASALTGSFNCGEVPRFSFVMLNACQVGTAGASLGQAAGFPGTLVRRGVLGFIAPLWEVDDKLAFEFAASFYKDAFTEGKPIGALLHEHRAAYDPAGSTTPVAYIYYGHPALRLTYGVS